MEHVRALLALKSIGQSDMQLTVNSESEASGFKDTMQMRTDSLTLNIFTSGPTQEPPAASNEDMTVPLQRLADFQKQGIDPKFVTKEGFESFFR